MAASSSSSSSIASGADTSQLRARGTGAALVPSTATAAGAAAAGAGAGARSHSTDSHSQSHSHSHSPFSAHTHSHSGDSEEAAALAAAFSGASDRGSKIILWGLASNVGLTVAKGLGGYFLHSASLLADAGHSLSDLLGDLVVLFSWRLSRRPASKAFQFGYGKFEALGSLLVASLLVGGALGIGVHSYFLFLQALSHAASGAAPELAHAADTMLSNSSSLFGSLGEHGHSHSHAHTHTLDPNAAWVAFLSVAIKEWMYRATLKVAKEEGSNVLEANALHHRSDVFSGALAGVAIVGSSLGFPMLDPVGGLLVAGMIIKSGSEIGLNALKELVDYVVDPELNEKVRKYVLSLRDGVFQSEGHDHDHAHEHEHAHERGHDDHAHAHEHEHAAAPIKLPIVSISSVRTFKSGTYLLLDLAVGFPPTLTIQEASQAADRLSDAVKAKFPSVKEVVVRFDADSEGSAEKI